METVEQAPSGIVASETLKEAQHQDHRPVESGGSLEGAGKADPEAKEGEKTEGEGESKTAPMENGQHSKTLSESGSRGKESEKWEQEAGEGSKDDRKEESSPATHSKDQAKDGPTPKSFLAQAPLAGPETSSATASPRHDQTTQEYHLKWVDWNKRKTPIVTQNENGPCPLIAILNVLLLRAVIEIPEGVEIVTATQLFNYLGNAILQRIPEDATEAVRKNFEKNMSDAMEIVSKLQTGLDVNVRFTGVSDFEYTQECLIFDLLNISLFHGWLYDPQNTELISAIGTHSYNQLVEDIIEKKHSKEELELHQGLVAEQFLQSSAAQLTYHGLCELNSTIKNNQLCVLFRNNHFSTLCKHDDILYILVTDQGFLTASNVVWESLSNVEGDSLFYDGAFQRCQPDIKPEAVPSMSMEQQIDSDFLVALSMQEDSVESSKPASQDGPVENSNITDQELAMKLQEEEDLQAAQMVQEREQAAAAAAGQQGGGQQRQAGGAPNNGAMAPPQAPQAAAQDQRQGRREPKEKSCAIV